MFRFDLTLSRRVNKDCVEVYSACPYDIIALSCIMNMVSVNGCGTLDGNLDTMCTALKSVNNDEHKICYENSPNW